MEKVIREWRIIETDDGFRIEIKGDKKAIRRCVERFRSHGPGRRFHHRPHFGPRHAGFWSHGFGCCDQEMDAEEPAEE